MPSSLVCCLGGHRVLKPMHPPEIALIQDEESMIQVAGKSNPVNGGLVSRARG